MTSLFQYFTAFFVSVAINFDFREKWGRQDYDAIQERRWKGDCSGYRGIPFLDVTAKVFARVVCYLSSNSWEALPWIAVWFPPEQVYYGHDLLTASNLGKVPWTSPVAHCLCWLDENIDILLRVPTHFQEPFSTLFQYLCNAKWSWIASLFIFSKFYSWNSMQEASAELSSVLKSKIWINWWLNLKFPYFFNTSRQCFSPGFLRNLRVPLEQTEIAWDEIRKHSSMRLQIQRHIDLCIRFHKEPKHSQKVPLQQKVEKHCFMHILAKFNNVFKVVKTDFTIQ